MASMPRPLTSSRNCCCHSGWAASSPTKEVSDEVSVSCAAIIRKLMWSMMSWVDSSAPSSCVAWHSCENRSSPPPLRAAERNLFGEVGDDPLAACNAAAHLRERQRPPDRRHGGGHHVDEGAGDLVDLRPDVGAEERRRRQIERELLHRRIHQHLARLRLPLRDPRGNAAVEIDEIGLHRPRLERDRQRAAVQAVLFEIQQHQPARKQQAEDRSPASVEENWLRLVEQHQLVGIGPEQHEAGLAEQMAAIDQTVFGRPTSRSVPWGRPAPPACCR